jgi:guanylate kinase
MMRENLLFILSGPSGVGKTSLIKRLSEIVPDLGLPVSHTSREPREGEIDGVHYYFTPPEEMDLMETYGDLIESSTKEDGTKYGLSRGEIRRMRRYKAAIVDLDADGARAVKTLLEDRSILIMVVPAYGDELALRLKARGTESPQEIDRRLGRAVVEVSASNEYDYLVVNDNLEEAAHQVAAIIQAEQLRMTRAHNMEQVKAVMDDLCGTI